jgi:hypothetical protein
VYSTLHKVDSPGEILIIKQESAVSRVWQIQNFHIQTLYYELGHQVLQ